MFKKFFDCDAYTEEEIFILEKLIVFDKDRYLSEYPDIAAAGVDPIKHFLSTGLYEGRIFWDIKSNSTPIADESHYGVLPALQDALGFNENFYKEKYPDIQANYFLHFINHGMAERRLPFNLHDNKQAEDLVWRVLKSSGMTDYDSLDQQLQIVVPKPSMIVDRILEECRQHGIIPKTYRNNFWLALAICFLAKKFYGAASLCYNYFYNYFIPIPQWGNWKEGIVVAGRFTPTIDYAKRNNLPVALLPTQKMRSVPDPKFLNRPNDKLTCDSYKLPQSFYSVINDVTLIGGSSLLITNTHEFLYDYADVSPERQAELKGPNILHVVDDGCSLKYVPTTVVIDEAFSLIHDHGHNYFHWLIEVLPRFLLARRNGLADGVPILIDEQISHLKEDILYQLLGKDAMLIKVPRNQSLRVRKLHWVSDLSVNTVHTLRHPIKSDILISPTAIEILREIAIPFFTTGVSQYEKVHIVRRNVEFRRLINRNLLNTTLAADDFWGFDPGSATFEEQVRVFSNARLIVAEAGAALANLVFCQPGTVVCVLVNGYENSNYYYLAEMAESLQIKLVFFECMRLVGSHKLGVHDDMIVKISELRSHLLQLDEQAKLARSAATKPVKAVNKVQRIRRR